MKKISATKLRKRLIKQCDDLVSQKVRQRDKYCVTCGFGKQRHPILQCGHLFSRRYMSLRFDLDNCHAQCQYCNSLHRFDDHPYNAWFIEMYGVEKWNYLYAKRKELKSWKVWELEELKAKLKLQL